jgi:hypothetical protein
VVTVVVAVLVAVALRVGVVAVVAVDAANVDGDVPVVDLVVPAFAAAVAAVERYHQRQYYWLHEWKRACRSRACLFVCDGISLEPRAQALTASERLHLAPRRVLFPVYDFCGEELTIGSRLAQRCSRILYAVPDNENTLAYSCQVKMNSNKGSSLCVTRLTAVHRTRKQLAPF